MGAVTVPLNQSAVCTLDENGDGTAQLGPINGREVWSPLVVSVSVNEDTVFNEAQCQVFCGEDTSQPNFVGNTLSGSTGDSTDNVAGQQIMCGQYVFAVWTGGDPGQQGFLNVTGTKVINGANIH